MNDKTNKSINVLNTVNNIIYYTLIRQKLTEQMCLFQLRKY